MKEIDIKIKGMTCDHCSSRVEKALNNTTGISGAEVRLNESCAFIKYDETIVSEKEIVDTIVNIGYKTSLKEISKKKLINSKVKSLIEIALIFFIVLLLYYLIKELTGFNFLNIIPEVNSNASFLMLFTVGIITSIHCISMCGGIMMSISLAKDKSYKNPIMYNLGRIVSYTIIGAFVGLIGSTIAINDKVQFIVLLFASLFMFVMGLSYLDVISYKFSFKFKKININISKKSPFVIGFLNGFMPCGALQTMELYAVATGSVILGALSMLVFALGTVPLMLTVGLLLNSLKNKNILLFKRIGGVLVILLAFVMFNRALSFVGLDITKINYYSYEVSTIKEDYQEVTINLTTGGYKNIVVQKGIKVKLNIYVEERYLNDCNNRVVFEEWNIEKKLEVGDNIIEFIPTETGDYLYTCWMNMLWNHVIVVDDINNIESGK